MSLRSRKIKIHFIGIGGIGMSGIAEILFKLGHFITGSDLGENKQTQNLCKLGVKVQKGHDQTILESYPPDVVVYSNAISPDNPEWQYARQMNIPIIRRAEMLAEIMNLKRGIAIGGSHGKTTTTGLVSLILKKAKLDPSIVIGGQFKAISSNASLGGGQWMITEADESDGSFLKLTPEIAVVTNIDKEHLDHYESEEAIVENFFSFIDKVPFYGKAILCSDDEKIFSLKEKINKPCCYYGTKKENNPDFLISDIELGSRPKFSLKPKDASLTPLNISMNVPGQHNILNATAAALVGLELGVSHEIIESALATFEGVDRRYEFKGEWRGRRIIEDYAHHPTEIKVTLKAAKEASGGRKPIVIFQPHRYSRTIGLWEEFQNSFLDAEELILLPIYPGSEQALDWMNGKTENDFLLQLNHPKTTFAHNFSEAITKLKEVHERINDLGTSVFILGAGDVYKLCPQLIDDEV